MSDFTGEVKSLYKCFPHSLNSTVNSVKGNQLNFTRQLHRRLRHAELNNLIFHIKKTRYYFYLFLFVKEISIHVDSCIVAIEHLESIVALKYFVKFL